MSRDDWLNAALGQCAAGVDTIKIAPLAEKLGVTTGSFYWHFKDRRDLLHALLEFWEREMTDSAIEALQQFRGSPTDRIRFLMEAVTQRGLARYDQAILLWSQSDSDAARAFARVIRKRFAFTTRLYAEAMDVASQIAVSAPSSTERRACGPPRSVLTQPGHMAFTRTAFSPSSLARTRVSAFRPAFETR